VINEEKVRIMTKCACYEKNEIDNNLHIAGYFRRDFVRWNVLKSLIFATFGYVLLLMLYFIANYEEIFTLFNKMQYKPLLIKILVGWGIILIIYAVVARIVYRKRFEEAREGVNDYYDTLKKLRGFYIADRDSSPRFSHQEGDPLNNDEFIDY
jgi:hypothetical protein